MNSLFNKIMDAKRKRLFFGYKSLYRNILEIREKDLDSIEEKYHFSFPEDVKTALIAMGSCTVADELNLHQPREIYPLGESDSYIDGFFVFASDTDGNYFLFNPENDSEEIYFYCHDPLGVCVIGSSFVELLEKFVENKFSFDGLIQYDQLQQFK